MYSFSKRSQRRLDSCDARLREVFEEVIKYRDCSVLEGHRDEERQNELKRQGFSKLSYPLSKHNVSPSLAVDVSPYPIDWTNLPRFTYFAGFVMGIAASKGIKLRWGGDWNMNNDIKDERFLDFVHFEVLGER